MRDFPEMSSQSQTDFFPTTISGPGLVSIDWKIGGIWNIILTTFDLKGNSFTNGFRTIRALVSESFSKHSHKMAKKDPSEI